jgi:FMN phosphatase YigB (HAD superfamily)
MIKAIVFDFYKVFVDNDEGSYIGGLSDKVVVLEHFALNEGLLEFAKKLSQRYQLFIFTTGFIHNEIEIHHKISKIFTYAYNINEIGHTKNEPEAYTTLASLMNIKPEEIVFIDDSQENVDAAKKAGCTAIRFQTNEQIINDLELLLAK